MDTSAWIEALRPNGDPAIAFRVKNLFRDGHACWNEMILLELWNGARGDGEKALIKDLEKMVSLLSVTTRVWEKANEIARALRLKGQTVPNTDLLIYATAACYKVSIEHNDKHFDILSGIE